MTERVCVVCGERFTVEADCDPDEYADYGAAGIDYCSDACWQRDAEDGK